MISIRLKLPALLSCLAVLCLMAGHSFGQSKEGVWDEVKGKRVMNMQGVKLGHVSDTAIDLEAGRYVGLMISYGGFLGMGETTKFVPFGVMQNNGTQGVIYLNMDETKFRNAPNMVMSKVIGPPDAAQMANIYHYYGVKPYFTTEITSSPKNGQTLEQLGYVQPGANILLLPVQNLQGKVIGTVIGLHNLDQYTGRVGGIVIAPTGSGFGTDGGEDKIVLPEALRYNFKHTALRLNDHYQEFKDSPKFRFSSTRSTFEESPNRPGTPNKPVVQGNSARDKEITLAIQKRIRKNGDLSHYGKTIEVGTVNGNTTLRGRVISAKNKNEIMASAEAVACRGNVSNLLEIAKATNNEMTIDSHPVARKGARAGGGASSIQTVSGGIEPASETFVTQ